MHLTKLWKNIESRLDSELSDWRDRISDFDQVQAVEDRRSGRKKTWTDDEVFEALLMSVLSANTDWSKVEKVQADIKPLFADFSLRGHANLRGSDVTEVLVPWFKKRKAGTIGLPASVLSRK